MPIILLIVDIWEGAFVGWDSCKGAERVGGVALSAVSPRDSSRPLASWPGLGARGKKAVSPAGEVF